MELIESQNFKTQSTVESPRPLCHCLNICEAEVREVISTNDVLTVRGVAKICGAGGGCTACHRHIKRLIAEQLRHDRMETADSCFSGRDQIPCHSPIEPAMS